MRMLDATNGIVGVLKERYKGWEGAKQFMGTPERLGRMMFEFCWTTEAIFEEVDGAFQKTFDHPYDEMLVVEGISVWTLCPHHLLPCHFMVNIGCVPDGRVLGLSKFARVAEVLARRPIMQEEYSNELAEIFMERLRPKGIAVYVLGVHGCMTARGVRQHSRVVTSTIRGVFESQAETRAEFFALCKSREGKNW